MTIFDVTNEVKSTAIDWTLTGRYFAAQFPQRVSNVKAGLMAILTTNPTRTPIYNKNNGDSPMVICNPNASSLKVGHFQGGLTACIKIHHDHYRVPDGRGSYEQRSFADDLKSFLILDLTKEYHVEISQAGKHWHQSAINFVNSKGYGDIAQPLRSRSRFLPNSNFVPTSREITDQLRKALAQLHQ